MASKSVIIAVLLSMAMVTAAGCAGWGTDGPTDPEEETDSNGEAQADEESENEASDRAENGGTETSDDTSSTSDSDTGVQDSSESSDTTSDTSQSNGSGSDESTDETGATGNGDSQTDADSSADDSDDTGDAPAPSDSDEFDSDGSDSPNESDGEGSSDENDSQNDSDETDSNDLDSSDDSNESDNGDDTDDSTGNETGDSDNETDDEEETHTLTVQVYNSEGEPVEGADVSLVMYDPGEPVDEGVTDSSGEAQFTVPNGSYEVTVSGVEDAQSTLDMGTSVQGEDTTHTVNLYDPDDDMHLYSATIQVVDEDGNPIPNELVEVGPVDTELQRLITDENGEVTVEFGNSSLDDAVMYEAVVRGESHSFSVERGVQHEQIVVSDDSERQTHELTVNAGERVGIEGVDVTIERWDGQTTTKTTGEDGQVTFDVYPGEYTITGVDPRGEEQSVDVTVPDQQEVLLDEMAYPAPDEVETTLTVVDQNGDPVEGVTVEAMTSIPPHYADVYIQSEPTNENGEVVVEAHAGQNYSIDRIEDTDGNSYQVVSVGDGMTLHVNEDGESDEIVVERPAEATQQSFTATA